MTKKLTDEEFHELYRPYEVDRLYRYRSLSSRGIEDIFTKHEVYIPSPLKFNDPFDCKPIVKLHSNRYKREKFVTDILKETRPYLNKSQVKKIAKNFMRQGFARTGYLHDLFERFADGFGIYSLSEIRDDILMWSHYAESHTGICIEFDSTPIDTLFWEAMKVTYQDEYPAVNIMDIGSPGEFYKAFGIKATHWAYEEERRVFKEKKNRGPGVYKFEPELLKGVILGARITPENEARVRSWIQHYPTPICIYKAKLNEKLFMLDIEAE